MDRKLVDYLPEYLREYAEEKAALEAAEPELENIWQISEKMLKESFILTEGIYGSGRWEKILKLYPKDTDSLEKRNLRILAKINETLPYTMRTLKRFLTTCVGEGNFEIFLDEKNFLLDIQILLDHLGKVKEIMEYVEQVTPANLVLFYIGKQVGSYDAEVQTEACFTVRGDFYPRYNLEYLYLDGSWFQDGTYQQDGYKSGTGVDFYPVTMEVGGEVSASPKIQGYLTVERNLWYFNGEYLMNGEKKFNAAVFEYDL